jgi:hypothetical protein
MEQTQRKSIFNIQEDYLRIMWELEESGGEITPELDQALAINEDELESKMKAYANFIKLLNSDINAVKTEVERLNAIKTAKENTIERLRKVMLDALLLMGKDGEPNKETGKTNKKLKYDTLSLWTVNRDSVQFLGDEDGKDFTDEEFISYEIKQRFDSEEVEEIRKALDIPTIVTTKIISKEGIKDAINEGRTIEGAILETKPSITIK